MHRGEVAQAHAHRFGLDADDGRGVAAVAGDHNAIEFFAKVIGDDVFVGAVVWSVFVEIFEHLVKERAVVSGADLAHFRIKRLQSPDLREVEAQGAFEVMFETGNTDSGDGFGFFEVQLPGGRRRMSARAGRGGLKNCLHARGQLVIRTTEEEARRAIGFAFRAKAAATEAEAFGSVRAEETGEKIRVAGVAGGLGSEPELSADGIRQEGVFGLTQGQRTFAATGDAEDRRCGPRSLEPTEDLNGLVRCGGEDAAFGQTVTMESLLPIAREVAE